MRGHSKQYLPDGKGGHKYYNTKSQYRILIASNELQKLVKLGFKTNRLQINNNKILRHGFQNITF